MCWQPALSPASLKFLLPVKFWKNAKKMGAQKRGSKEKEKEIVLIMPYMFFLRKNLPYLGNTYP